MKLGEKRLGKRHWQLSCHLGAAALAVIVAFAATFLTVYKFALRDFGILLISVVSLGAGILTFVVTFGRFGP
jgi:hypothetical protein